MAKHSITAVFDTRAHADQAVAELRSSGIAASDITLLPAAGETATYTDEAEGRTRGFWGSLEQLFGGTEDHATYAESIRRGGMVVTVRAEDADLDRAVEVLERHGSVDLDEREASWRSEGWSGGPGVNDPGMTAMGDAPAGAAETRMGTLGAGVLGAGALGAGALGTAASGERAAGASIPRADERLADEPLTGRTPLAADRAATDRTVGVLSAAPAPAATGAPAPLGRGASAADETVKVYEERLDVGKRAVSRGKVRVRTSVVSRDVDENVTLHGETVTVDRRTVDRPVSAAALDADPFQERTIELEEFAEEAVVAKSAHLVEEIGIRKEGTDRVETVHETLRSTKVDVEDDRTGRSVAGATAGVAGRFAAAIRDDMEVVGSDGAHVGIVDHMDGGRIKLKKNDAASGGEHHFLTEDIVGSVAGKVMLAVTAAEARARWTTA